MATANAASGRQCGDLPARAWQRHLRDPGKIRRDNATGRRLICASCRTDAGFSRKRSGCNRKTGCDPRYRLQAHDPGKPSHRRTGSEARAVDGAPTPLGQSCRADAAGAKFCPVMSGALGGTRICCDFKGLFRAHHPIRCLSRLKVPFRKHPRAHRLSFKASVRSQAALTDYARIGIVG